MTDNNSPNKTTSNDANNQNTNASKLRLNFNNSLGSGSSSGSSKKSGENTSVQGASTDTEVSSLSDKLKKSSSGELSLSATSKARKSNSSESALSVPAKSSNSVPPLPKDNDLSTTPDVSLSAPAQKEVAPPTKNTTEKKRPSAEVKITADANLQKAAATSSPLKADSNDGLKPDVSTSNLRQVQPTSEVAPEPTAARRLAPPLEVPQVKTEAQPRAAQVSSNQQIAQTADRKETDAVKTKTGDSTQLQEDPIEAEANEEQGSEAPVSASREDGTAQDLLVGAVYLVFLAGFLAWGSNSLLTWKHDLDVQPSTSYNQLCWSQSSDSLAFVRDENKQLSKGQSIKSSLWVSDRFGDQVSCLQDSLPEKYSLTGWFDSDSLLVLNSSQPLDLEKFKQAASDKKASQSQAKTSTKEETIQLTEVDKNEICGVSADDKPVKNGLSFIEIKTKDNSVRYLNLAIENTQVVGSSKDEVFMAQYLTSDKDRGQINLLSYKPGNKEAKVLVSIPSRQDEMMHVDSVVASPNNDKLAIVISVMASLSKSVSEDDDTPLGVWLFNRESKALAWTTIAANNARDLSVVWSKDAKWLGGVARYADEAELFAFYGDNDCQAAKLRGVPQEGDIIPLITGKDHALTFVSLNRVDRYNFDLQQNTPMLSADNLEYMPSNFAVSSNGTVAYAATPYNTQNIYICTLNNPNSNIVNIPADSAKHTWLYRAVGSLQYAADYWCKAE